MSLQLLRMELELMRSLELPSIQERENLSYHQSCLQVELAASLGGELPGTGGVQTEAAW